MKKLSLLIICFLFVFNGLSQNEELDSKYRPRFGFQFGLNYSLLYNGKNSSLEIINAPGFSLGVNSDFPLNQYLSIAPKAELAFNYGRIRENDITYRVNPYTLNFMTHLKYSMKGFTGKFKPYCYIGPNLSVPFRGSFTGNLYDSKPSLAIDFALGVDIELKQFLISPELRFSGGVTDIRNNPSGRILNGSSATLLINFSSK